MSAWINRPPGAYKLQDGNKAALQNPDPQCGLLLKHQDDGSRQERALARHPIMHAASLS